MYTTPSTSVPQVLLSSPPIHPSLYRHNPPNNLYVIAVRTLQNPLKIVLPSGLSNLYESLTASLKGKMSLICHVAMKRGRSSSWVWQWREGWGRGRRMRCEVVLHTYRHFRWDADAIRRGAHAFASDSTATSLLFSPYLNLPIVHRLLLVCCRPLTHSG